MTMFSHVLSCTMMSKKELCRVREMIKAEGKAVRKPYLHILLLSIFLVLLTGCTLFTDEADGQEVDQTDDVAGSDHDVAIELTAYAQEIGAEIHQPESRVLSVEQSFSLAGTIREAGQLQRPYIWVELQGPDTGTFDYYFPLEDGGHFEGEITLFEGKGLYDVTVRAPDKEVEDRFYDIANLEVTNNSAEITRDIALRPSGLEAGLHLSRPNSGYAEADGSFQLEGEIDEAYNGQQLMVKEEKDGEISEMLLPIEAGTFAGDIPLYFGKGRYEVTVMVPDLTRDDYFLESAVLIIDNAHDAVMEPIQFYKNYYDQKFQLDVPKASVLETGETLRIAGHFDPDLESNRKVEQLIVTTKKEGEEASYLIPARKGQFSGEIWLRFGPGEYEVTLNVPTNPEAEQSYFEFAALARFSVTSDAQDQRYLMPSRGIQSDASEISKLANDLTRGKKNDRAKAKAIYEFVAKTVKYDVQKLENDAFRLDDSALKTLDTEKGVCQDYAFLTVALLRSIGIEARYIGGTAQSGTSGGERHAWVEAKVDGDWLVMDPTWGAGYVQDGQFVAHYNDHFFDPDPQEFKKTHHRDEVIY